MGPLLAICVPTYNRASELSRLLECLDREVAAVDDVVVLVSDNASQDDTAELLAAATATRPWLRAHRQVENIGAPGNIEWLVDNAPDADYAWIFCDDDVLVPGALDTARALLLTERPTWLFLPHHWVDEDANVVGGSPAPGMVERYATGPDLYRAYHHWLTFASASIVRRDRLQDAVRRIETENAYAPLLWYYAAGFEGPCLVAAEHMVHGSQAISWRDRAHIFQTQHFLALYDDGLRVGLTEAEFARSLDGLYCGGFAYDHWQRNPVADLIAAVERFPQSAGLRWYLWSIARERGLREILPTLTEAAKAARVDERAASLVEAGETTFERGDLYGAAQQFREAAELMPTLGMAWNDLAVTLHRLGDPAAAAAAASALFAAPEDEAARENHAHIVGDAPARPAAAPR